VVLTAPNSAIGGAPWAVAAFVVAPILWAAGSLLTAHGDRPADRVVANAVQLLAGGTVLLLLALSLDELDPARWSDISLISVGAAVFLLVFDSLVGFMLYARLLTSAPAPLVSTYAYVTPLVGAVMGATVLDEPLWAGAFVERLWCSARSRSSCAGDEARENEHVGSGDLRPSSAWVAVLPAATRS
jgi:drug/metabolite transporter (DMT)-like permease